MKRYYAVESTKGRVSIASSYGQPKLYIFWNAEDRDSFIRGHELFSENNVVAWKITAKEAYKFYSHIVDGVREWNENVEQ